MSQYTNRERVNVRSTWRKKANDPIHITKRAWVDDDVDRHWLWCQAFSVWCEEQFLKQYNDTLSSAARSCVYRLACVCTRAWTTNRGAGQHTRRIAPGDACEIEQARWCQTYCVFFSWRLTVNTTKYKNNCFLARAVLCNIFKRLWHSHTHTHTVAVCVDVFIIVFVVTNVVVMITACRECLFLHDIVRHTSFNYFFFAAASWKCRIRGELQN